MMFMLPIAAFAVVWMLGGEQSGNAAENLAATPQAGFADNIEADFALCSGPSRETCVVDGDTLWFAGTKIRVADIDAPEVSKPGCAREAQLGAMATERFMALLNQAAFTLEPDPDSPDTDRYGRALRLVTRGGTSLGGVLVDEGLAERWGGPRIDWC